jgi:hypothetical protein
MTLYHNNYRDYDKNKAGLEKYEYYEEIWREFHKRY